MYIYTALTTKFLIGILKRNLLVVVQSKKQLIFTDRMSFAFQEDCLDFIKVIIAEFVSSFLLRAIPAMESRAHLLKKVKLAKMFM